MCIIQLHIHISSVSFFVQLPQGKITTTKFECFLSLLLDLKRSEKITVQKTTYGIGYHGDRCGDIHVLICFKHQLCILTGIHIKVFLWTAHIYPNVFPPRRKCGQEQRNVLI
jgi:hypothetical protein